MIRALALALATSGLLAGSAAAQAAPNNRGLCASAYPSATRQVVRALSQPRLNWFKRMYRLTAIEAQDLRVLGDRDNADVCRRLNEYYAQSVYARSPYRHTYYRAKGYYFASFIDTTDPQSGKTPSLGHFAVFNSRLDLVARLSPK